MEDLESNKLTDGEQGEGEAGVEESGPIKCPECALPYTGPSSLKRHLWRIHRLSGDDAQVMVDAAVAAYEEETGGGAVTQDEPPEPETPSNSNKTTPAVQPLLDMTVTPKVRPLLSLPAEPPGYQANNFGGISPAPQVWSQQGGKGGSNIGGSGQPQVGLLPTPGCEEEIEEDYILESNEQSVSVSESTAPTSNTIESGSGKIKALMDLDFGVQQASCGAGGAVAPVGAGVGAIGGPVGGAGAGGGQGGGQGGGIPSLMSLPLYGGGGSFMHVGLMGGNFNRNNNRRRDRRSRPYGRDRHSGNQNGSGSGGQSDNSNMGNNQSNVQGEPEACGECGAEFQDSADLTDHEIDSHNVSIDLNCDVELTA